MPEVIGWEEEIPGDGMKEKKLKSVNIEALRSEERRVGKECLL